jgi:uncharacterized protein YkwD
VYVQLRKALAGACLLFVSASLGACANGTPVGPDLPETATGVPSSGVDEIVRLTNSERAANGLAALVVSESLARAAEIQAGQMADAHTMAHTLPGAEFPTLASRAQAVGYEYSWIAENIAYGYASAERVMEGWNGSAPHRANILDSRVAEIGVAIAVASDGVPYYATVFGRAR